MKPIDPAEFSAYLDGELDPQRARELEEAMQRDSALRAEFERLGALDAGWRSAADTARFAPRLQPPPAVLSAPGWFSTGLGRAWVAPAFVLILVVRFLPKMLASFPAGMALQAAVLGVILFVVARWLSAEDAREAPATSSSV